MQITLIMLWDFWRHGLSCHTVSSHSTIICHSSRDVSMCIGDWWMHSCASIITWRKCNKWPTNILLDWKVNSCTDSLSPSKYVLEWNDAIDFPHSGPVPSLEELERNISFRIINTHRSMMPPRPTMPGLAYVAGIQIKPPKALPVDIQVSQLT